MSRSLLFLLLSIGVLIFVIGFVVALNFTTESKYERNLLLFEREHGIVDPTLRLQVAKVFDNDDDAISCTREVNTLICPSLFLSEDVAFVWNKVAETLPVANYVAKKVDDTVFIRAQVGVVSVYVRVDIAHIADN